MQLLELPRAAASGDSLEESVPSLSSRRRLSLGFCFRVANHSLNVRDKLGGGSAWAEEAPDSFLGGSPRLLGMMPQIGDQIVTLPCREPDPDSGNESHVAPPERESDARRLPDSRGLRSSPVYGEAVRDSIPASRSAAATTLRRGHGIRQVGNENSNWSHRESKLAARRPAEMRAAPHSFRATSLTPTSPQIGRSLKPSPTAPYEPASATARQTGGGVELSCARVPFATPSSEDRETPDRRINSRPARQRSVGDVHQSRGRNRAMTRPASPVQISLRRLRTRANSPLTRASYDGCAKKPNEVKR